MKSLGKKVLASTIIVNILLFYMFAMINEFSVKAEELENNESKNFIHTENGKLVDKYGNEFNIQAIGFGNGVWSGQRYSEKDHTEESYKEIAEMGLNTVRFYMSCTWFEDYYRYDEYISEDENGNEINTYKYKEMGWKILDQNIQWAKKYNIKLILNLHIPQGGFQSLGKGMTLWLDSEKDDEGNITSWYLPSGEKMTNNQKRLQSLWIEIADRYKDEDTIIGYDLLNEPYVPCLNKNGDIVTINEDTSTIDSDMTWRQWPKLAKKITDSIREVDTNHIIFIESTNCSRTVNLLKVNDITETTKETPSSYTIGLYYTYKYFSKPEENEGTEEKNYVAEVHCYEPLDLTYARGGKNEDGTPREFTDTNRVFTNKDKGKLEGFIKSFANWRDTADKDTGNIRNVPVFLGEFGAKHIIFENLDDSIYRGGKEYVGTVLNSCRANNIHFSYHSYHGLEFGLYDSFEHEFEPKEENLNKVLKSAFIEGLDCVDLKSDKQTINIGDKKIVTVRVKNPGDSLITECSGKLEYDKTIFEEISQSDIKGVNGWKLKEFNTDGTFSLTKESGITEEEDAIEITLTAKDSGKTNSEIMVKDVNVGNYYNASSSMNIILTKEGKYIANLEEKTNVNTVLKKLNIGETIEIYNHNNEKIEGEAVIGTGMKLRLSGGKEYKLVVGGDLNGDGKVSITDLSKMKLHLIRKQLLENEYEKAMDMNNDGNNSVTDLSIIKKYILNK